MKILLLGEVSGVHRELRGGLERLGHTVVQAHSGDSYRRFSADLMFPQVTASPRQPVEFAKQVGQQLRVLRHFSGFDVVQFISPKFFYWRLQREALRWLKRANRAVVMVNVSCSAEFNTYMRSQPYSPCAECKRFDIANACPWERPDERAFEEDVYRRVDALMATHFWYHESLRRLALPTPLFAAPLPLELTGVPVTPPRIDGPLRVYYGETRHGFKGGLHIKAALERLRASHGDRVELVQSTRLPFDEYLRMLDGVDVLVDQANSAGMGMNALYAMARGKVALSGLEPEGARAIGTSPEVPPVVPIGPDADQIHRALSALVENREATRQRGVESRAFVERVHSSDVVAGQYEAMFRALLQ